VTLWKEEFRRCGVVDIAANVKKARLRWHALRRDEGYSVRDIMISEEDALW
jgi:hypothetical protein